MNSKSDIHIDSISETPITHTGTINSSTNPNPFLGLDSSKFNFYI